MNIQQLLLSNYLPYAKMTIISRAIPGIDGLKPVQRRLLDTMRKMGLQGDGMAKCQRINGQTMAIHPHGDSSIYEAMILMSSGHGALNVPYVKSKGNFGAHYSRDLKYAAPRYTEAKLADICKELFEGINENAVDFRDNFDGTEKEPVILPVKFPNILVNTNSGVAVGTSSNIPSFSLRNVCLATQGILNGTITTPEELAKTLGAPEFTTGGFLHADEASLVKLCKTGKGSFTISGHVDVYSNQIVVDEIPYCTTAEDITDAIEERMKNNELRGVKNVRDEIGYEGLRLVIEIKSGFNSREVLNELCRLTPLRSVVSFRTRVIVDDRCQELGLFELIEKWIEFRQNCIFRMYSYRVDKDTITQHQLETWDKIKHDIPGVVQMISKNTDAVAKQNLIKDYGLDDEQAEYLLEMRIRSITTDRAEKALKNLEEVTKRLEYEKLVISDEAERKNIIIKDLQDIIEKYGTDNKTVLAPKLDENANKKPEYIVSDEIVTVVLTKNGYIRRFTKDLIEKFVSNTGDEEAYRWTMRNNQHLLVFDRFGSVHKLLVDDIDSSRGKLTDLVHEKSGLEKASDIIWIDACGDYTGYFNIVYPNGKGVRVNYDDAKPNGNRTVYKIGYAELEPKKYFITLENKFFLVTARNKASYCDIENLGIVTNRTAFKVARLSNNDYFTRLIPYKNLPNPDLIDLEKYNKDYTVSIGNDILWVDSETRQAAKDAVKKRLQESKEYEEAEKKKEEERAKKEAEKQFKI